MRVVNTCVCCLSRNLTVQPALLSPFIADRIFGWKPVSINEDNAERIVIAAPVCKTLVCQECGLVFCDIRFDGAEMGKLYTGYRDEVYISLREVYEPAYRTVNQGLTDGLPYTDKIEEFIRGYMDNEPERILDWGGDNGKNTPFKHANIDIFDISGKEPLFGKLVERPNPPYNAVVLSHVLEHVSYPSYSLSSVIEQMNFGTLLYIEVPLEPLQMFWHEHINLFSKDSLLRLADRSGLRVLGLKQFDHEDLHVFMLAARIK